ncbi:G patch domain-containing protein 11-like [Clavelina lepadiformis]
MVDEEDDYMSDKFLQVATNETLNDSISVVRKRKMEKNKSESDLKSKTKPKHVLEREQREKGLSTGLSHDNLGFKLMAKMGYKKGEGLGRKGEGRAEPIPFSVKANRSGLGKESSEKEKLRRREKLFKVVAEKRQKLESIRREDFRSRMSGKYANRQTERDLHKSQKACRELDENSSVKDPLYAFYWPDSLKTEEELDDEEEPEEEEYTLEEKLTLVTDYLRKEYFYCIWCASKFNDEDDLVKHCPGDTASAHDDEGW